MTGVQTCALPIYMVGEKMSPEAARQVLAKVAARFALEPVSLMAVNGHEQHRPRYVAVFSQSQQAEAYRQRDDLALAVDQELRGHFHYELARDLRQLEPALAIVARDGWATYQQVAIAGGMIEGNIKPEPVRRMARAAVMQVLPGLDVNSVGNPQLEKVS